MRDKTTESNVGPGDRLVRIGAVVFFAGAVATLVTVAPVFLGSTPFPGFMFGLSMLMPVGFAIAATGLLRTVRGQGRVAAGTARGGGGGE